MRMSKRNVCIVRHIEYSVNCETSTLPPIPVIEQCVRSHMCRRIISCLYPAKRCHLFRNGFITFPPLFPALSQCLYALHVNRWPWVGIIPPAWGFVLIDFIHWFDIFRNIIHLVIRRRKLCEKSIGKKGKTTKVGKTLVQGKTGTSTVRKTFRREEIKKFRWENEVPIVSDGISSFPWGFLRCSWLVWKRWKEITYFRCWEVLVSRVQRKRGRGILLAAEEKLFLPPTRFFFQKPTEFEKKGGKNFLICYGYLFLEEKKRVFSCSGSGREGKRRRQDKFMNSKKREVVSFIVCFIVCFLNKIHRFVLSFRFFFLFFLFAFCKTLSKSFVNPFLNCFFHLGSPGCITVRKMETKFFIS